MPSTPPSLDELEAEVAAIKAAIETTDETDKSALDHIADRADALENAVREHREAHGNV